VLVIEHNLDVIKTADWIIDLGPEGGTGGGTIIATGTPEEVANCPESHTGRALQSVLKPPSRRVRRNGKPSSNGQKSDDKLSTLDSQPSTLNSITIRGAAQHNLQSIDVTVPRDQMSVFCG